MAQVSHVNSEPKSTEQQNVYTFVTTF